MLADLADVIIGVDTHTGTHSAAAVDRLGAHLATIEVSADAAGYARLANFTAEHAAGLRTAWAIEGCGSAALPGAHDVQSVAADVHETPWGPLPAAVPRLTHCLIGSAGQPQGEYGNDACARCAFDPHLCR
jgi:hypothetical protein